MGPYTRGMEKPSGIAGSGPRSLRAKLTLSFLQPHKSLRERRYRSNHKLSVYKIYVNIGEGNDDSSTL